jgi:hypothetical protein
LILHADVVLWWEDDTRRSVDEGTAKEMLLRLRERAIRRELDGCDDPERIKELQGALARLREAVGRLASYAGRDGRPARHRRS